MLPEASGPLTPKPDKSIPRALWGKISGEYRCKILKKTLAQNPGMCALHAKTECGLSQG